MSKAEDLVSEVVRELRSRCQCEFTSDKITGGGFRCFPDSPQHVTYRGTIHGTLLASTSQLLGNLEEWVISGTPISIQAQLLSPDVTCGVAISSRGEDECRPTEMVTKVEVIEASDLPLSVIVICVSVAVVVLTIVLIVLVSFLSACCRRRRRSSALTMRKDLTSENVM